MIKREFLVSVTHPKGGRIVWTCVQYHIINEKEKCEAIGLHGFDYKLFEEEEGGSNREGLDGHPYLKHIIQLWTGDRVKQMEEMNEAIGTNNRLTMDGGNKELARTFRRRDFWKYIGFVLSEVNYRKKRHNIWSKVPKYFGNKAPTKLQRDVWRLMMLDIAFHRTFTRPTPLKMVPTPVGIITTICQEHGAAISPTHKAVCMMATTFSQIPGSGRYSCIAVQSHILRCSSLIMDGPPT